MAGEELSGQGWRLFFGILVRSLQICDPGPGWALGMVCQCMYGQFQEGHYGITTRHMQVYVLFMHASYSMAALWLLFLLHARPEGLRGHGADAEVRGGWMEVSFAELRLCSW